MFTTRPEIAGTFGVAASTHWLATAVGMAVLERGGNAFDAAVAAGFTLQIVERTPQRFAVFLDLTLNLVRVIEVMRHDKLPLPRWHPAEHSRRSVWA